MITSMIYFDIQTNSVDPDQTAPKGAVWSGSTLCDTDVLSELAEKSQLVTFSRDLFDAVCEVSWWKY